jgi:Glycine zipper 2TM domain
MVRKISLTAAALVTALALAATPAQAGSQWSLQPANSYDDDNDDWHNPDGDSARWQEANWRGERQRDADYRDGKRCDKGTGGLIIGGLAGGVIGNRIAKGDRTLGTILGAGVGALAGRAIDRSSSKRC